MKHLYYNYEPIDDKRYIIGSTMAAILAGVAIAGGIGTSVYATSQAGKKSEMPELPQTPTTENATKIAEVKLRQKKMAMSRSTSIFSSPLGIGAQAAASRKTLLGQ